MTADHRRWDETAVAYLTPDGHVLTDTQVTAWYRHPARGGDVRKVYPLYPTPCRPCGHDGATTDRYPGVPAGHMKETT